MLIFAAGLISLVCWIVCLIKAFKREETAIGVVGIFFWIVLYVWGWIRLKEANLKKVMIWWTLSIVLGIVGVGVMIAGTIPAAIEASKNPGLIQEAVPER